MKSGVRHRRRWQVWLALAATTLVLVPSCASSAQIEATASPVADQATVGPKRESTPEGEVRSDSMGPHVRRADGTTTSVKTEFTEIPDRWPADIPRPSIVDMEGTMSELFAMLSFGLGGVAGHSTDYVGVHDDYVSALLEAGFEYSEEWGSPGPHVGSAYKRPTGRLDANGYPISDYVELDAMELSGGKDGQSVYLTVFVQTWVDEHRTNPPVDLPTADDRTKAQV